jgi:TolB-like protein
VLPFVNMSSDKENEFLSDGITEEILNTLAKVPGLRVPARTSSFAFKNKKEDIKKIGASLNVNTVLEGSVRKAGNQLRITAQLINVADGFHLWSETYDRDMTNIFAIQDDIARNIVSKLKGTLLDAAELPGRKHYTSNVQAYESYLKGMVHAEKYTEADLKQAVAYLQQALAAQPDYALAYAGLARAYGWLRFFAHADPASVTRQYRDAVSKALELDDSLSAAHLSKGDLSLFLD